MQPLHSLILDHILTFVDSLLHKLYTFVLMMRIRSKYIRWNWWDAYHTSSLLLDNSQQWHLNLYLWYTLLATIPFEKICSCIYNTSQHNPSIIHPWIANPFGKILSFPSMCQQKLGPCNGLIVITFYLCMHWWPLRNTFFYPAFFSFSFVLPLGQANTSFVLISLWNT